MPGSSRLPEDTQPADTPIAGLPTPRTVRLWVRAGGATALAVIYSSWRGCGPRDGEVPGPPLGPRRPVRGSTLNMCSDWTESPVLSPPCRPIKPSVFRSPQPFRMRRTAMPSFLSVPCRELLD